MLNLMNAILSSLCIMWMRDFIMLSKGSKQTRWDISTAKVLLFKANAGNKQGGNAGMCIREWPVILTSSLMDAFLPKVCVRRWYTVWENYTIIDWFQGMNTSISYVIRQKGLYNSGFHSLQLYPCRVSRGYISEIDLSC